MKRARFDLWFVIGVLFLVALYLVAGPSRPFHLRGKTVHLNGDSECEFVALHLSPLVQRGFADGKEGRFRDTFTGPASLTLRERDGTLSSRLIWKVEIAGQAGTKDVTLTY